MPIQHIQILSYSNFITIERGFKSPYIPQVPSIQAWSMYMLYTYYSTRSRKCTFDAFYGFHGAFFEKFNICCSSQQKHLLKPFSHVKPIQFRNLRRSNNNNNKKCPLLTTYMHIHEGNSIFLLKDNNTGHISMNTILFYFQRTTLK